MKTITLEISDLVGGSYALRLFEFAGAAKAELARGSIPADLKPAGVKGDPLTFGDFVLTKGGARPELRQMGADLLSLLTTGDAKDVGAAWSELRKNAEPLRTLLEIEPEVLQLLPWELVFDDDNPQRIFDGQRRLSLSPDRAFVRSHLYKSDATSPPFSWPLRALIVIASKDAAIKADSELRLIEEALRPVNRTIDIEVMRLPTKAEMLKKIKEEFFPHILHFIGHSGQNANNEMVLWLEHEHDPGKDLWTALEIENDLIKKEFLRFVFLNSCRSAAAASVEDQKRTLSISRAFRNAGVPAVLAMQADVLGEHAGRLAGKVYEELSKGEPLDAALAAGRDEVQQAMNDGLNCREWALPVLTLAIPPDKVLPIARVSDENRAMRIKNCPKFLEVVPLFVNRKEERREFVRSFYPIAPGLAQYQLLVIRGNSETGKSWITYWCMEGCAWQDNNVRYIEVVNDKSKDWLDVLLQIRDGDEDQQLLSPLHEPLKPEAFHNFNWDLHHRLQGKWPPLWEGRPDQIINPPPQKGGHTIDDLVNSNEDFVKLTFESFRNALGQAADGKPLILVLDHFTRGTAALEASSMNELLRKLITPVISKPELNLIKIVLVLSKDEYETLYKIEEKIPKSLFYSVELGGLKRDEFEKLAAEFLRSAIQKAPPEDIDDIIRFWKGLYVRKDGWVPTELKKLYLHILKFGGE